MIPVQWRSDEGRTNQTWRCGSPQVRRPTNDGRQDRAYWCHMYLVQDTRRGEAIGVAVSPGRPSGGASLMQTAGNLCFLISSPTAHSQSHVSSLHRRVTVMTGPPLFRITVSPGLISRSSMLEVLSLLG